MPLKDELKFLRRFLPRNELCRLQYSDAVAGWNGEMLKLVNGIVALLIFISNSVLSYGIYKSKGRNKYSRNEKLVLLLSFIDFIVALIHTPLEIVLFGYLNEIGCITISIITFWIAFPLMFSGSILVLISIERFIVVFNDKKCCGVRFKGVYLLLIIIFNFIVSIGLGVWYALLHYFTPDNTLAYPNFFYSTATYMVTNLIFGLLINVLLLISTSKRLRNSEIQVPRHIAIEKRLTQTMMIISVSLIVSYLPSVATHYYLAIVLSLEDQLSILFAIKLVFWTLMLCKLNSALNAIIYVTRRKCISQIYISYFRSFVDKFRVQKSICLQYPNSFRQQSNHKETVLSDLET